MANVVAGAFDGWASQLVGSSVGGLLGIAAALVAIWLTRRSDHLKILQESALRAGEKIAEAFTQFIRVWENTSLLPPGKWQQRLKGCYVDAYLVWQVHGPAIQNSALAEYVNEYHQFVQKVFEEWESFIEFQAQQNRGHEVEWTNFEAQLQELDNLLRDATFELVDSLNDWRITFKFDRSKLTKINPELLADIHRAIYGVV